MRPICGPIFCLLCLVSSTKALADESSASSAIGNPFAGEELYDEYDDQDIAESESEWMSHPAKELETPQSDRRENAKQAVLIGAGEAALWTTLSLRWLQWIDPNLAWSIDGGIGNFPTATGDSRYSFVTKTRGLGSRIQWWPSAEFPLGLSAEGGVFEWTVKAKCGTGISSDKCQDGTFRASGASVASGILLSWLAEESIVVEWTVMGFKYTKLTKSSWDGGGADASEVEGETKASVTGAKIVSFANVSVGLRF